MTQAEANTATPECVGIQHNISGPATILDITGWNEPAN